MDFKKTFINMAVVGVIVLSLFSWIIITQTNNNTQDLITNNTLINSSYGSIASSAAAAQGSADSASSSFSTTTPTTDQYTGLVDPTLVLPSVSQYKGIALGFFNTVIQLPVKILGVSPVIAGIITAIFLLLLIIGGWAILKGVVA